MSIEENLTYLQKVALKGEIGFALSTSAHDAEIKFRTYLILKEVNKKYKPFVIDCIKDSATFDETIIDKICLEIANGTVPVWLWVDEVISDIKLHLSIPDTGSTLTGSKLSINRMTERKNIIESAFLYFAREALMISTSASESLFDEILNDYDLEFLHGACFYLKSCIPEIEALKKQDEVPEKLLSCQFDIRKTLSFVVESKALSLIDKKDSYHEESTIPTPPEKRNYNGNFEVSGNFTVSNSVPRENVSGYISKKITELLAGDPVNPSQPTSHDTIFIVKKVFTDSGISTDICTRGTYEEAVNFIEKIKKEYPELLNTCKFEIYMEKDNGRQTK